MSLSRRSTCNNNNKCAPCKFQRRKCVGSCILYPYFTTNKMPEFQASQKIFGVSNMTKMLSVIPPQDRPKAVESIVWEASRWQEDPVNGPLGFHKNLVRERDYLVEEIDFYKNQLLLDRNYALTLTNNDYYNHEEEPGPLATNYSNYNYYNNINKGDLEYLPLTNGAAGASFTSTDRHQPLTSFQENDPFRILGGPSNPPPAMINNYNSMQVRNSNNAAAGFVQSHHHQQILMNQQQQLGGNYDLDFYGSNLELLNEDEARAPTTTRLLPPRMGGPYIVSLSRHQFTATRAGDGSNWMTSQIGQGLEAFNHRNDNRGN